MSLFLTRSLFTAFTFAAVSTSGFAQLERCLEAHGGLEKWREYAGLEYDLTWSSAKGEKKDHQIFNLRTRDGLITSDKYTLGHSRGEVWIKPGLDALDGTPPRFYMWTPFYFFGMPFVFADPGAQQESLGRKAFKGGLYDAVKVTFQKGVGDTPNDYYVAYITPKSAQLKLVYYIATFPALRGDKPVDQLERHAIVFQEWQRADGLFVPKTAFIHAWKIDHIEGEALATLKFSAVRFSTTPPEQTQFAKPPDAVVAPLQ